MGIYFSILSVLMVIIQGPVLSRLTKKFSESVLIITGNLLLVVTFLMLLSGNTYVVFTSAVFFASGNGIMWPSVLSVLSKAAGKKYQGAIQGYASSLGSLASIIGLVLGGIIYSNIGGFTFIISAAVIFLVFVLSFRFPRNTKSMYKRGIGSGYKLNSSKMKKIIQYLFFILIALNNSLSFSQDNINIPEGNDTTICGKIVFVDALWVYEGTLKADISILEKQNSKPITGGYKKGDEITISSEPGCTYYIYDISKSGRTQDKGYVTLSKSPPEVIPELHIRSFQQKEGSSFKVGVNDWFIQSITAGGDAYFANIIITYNTELVDNIKLSNGEFVWYENNVYRVENIIPKFKDKIKDPLGNYEFNPGIIIFKAVSEYLNEK